MGLDGSRRCICESWIKFQALCFALSSLSSLITDQGIVGIVPNFEKISSHRAVPVLVVDYPKVHPDYPALYPCGNVGLGA